MNKEGKGKIEWCDRSWNPVTGCLHGCPYCYARRMAHRFAGYMDFEKTQPKLKPNAICDLEEPMIFYYPEPHKAPFPFDFTPTFHRYRLNEPQHLRKPATIFVVSMGDLFGEWVPDEWITQVFKACAAAPQNRYIFLTKNPGRFQNTLFTQTLGITPNMWFGFSAEDQAALSRLALSAKWLPQNTFVSIEPLHGEVDLKRIEPDGHDAILNFLSGGQYWLFGGDKAGKRLKWVILGAESGPGAVKRQPRREWVAKIVDQCRDAGVPVFMKSSLAETWAAPLIQEYPW